MKKYHAIVLSVVMAVGVCWASQAAVSVDPKAVPEAFWDGTADVFEPAAGWCVWRAKGADGDAARFAAIRAAQSEKKFVLLGALPAGGADADAFSAVNVRRRATNAALKKLANNKDVVFVDASARFRRGDGSTNPKLMTDANRLTPKAREYLVRQFEGGRKGRSLLT